MSSIYAASGRCSAARPPQAAEAKSVIRGRIRLPPAASMRLTASVTMALSVEKRDAKKCSTNPCSAGPDDHIAGRNGDIGVPAEVVWRVGAVGDKLTGRFFGRYASAGAFTVVDAVIKALAKGVFGDGAL